MAGSNIKLRKKLLSGIVVFEFQKKDKSIRKAIGTLNAEYIPPKHEELYFLKNLAKTTLKILQTKDNKDFGVACKDLEESITDYFSEKPKKERHRNADILSYYDFEAKSWRSFNVNSITFIHPN